MLTSAFSISPSPVFCRKAINNRSDTSREPSGGLVTDFPYRPPWTCFKSCTSLFKSAFRPVFLHQSMDMHDGQCNSPF
ncbi:expressed protein [Echinococcus multilocularis]|uniref:Expressed protein n=1 Tax=Echinococcus multilocularis TaxID=6211 RepID=A0A068YK08_ECHMU|nr:expressed protein [Echinococcus multilocularis]